jgi:hypothetical protein
MTVAMVTVETPSTTDGSGCGGDSVGPADPPVAIDLMDWRLIASSHPDQWGAVSKLSLGFVGSFTSTTELVDSRPTEALEGRHQQYRTDSMRTQCEFNWQDPESFDVAMDGFVSSTGTKPTMGKDGGLMGRKDEATSPCAVRVGRRWGRCPRAKGEAHAEAIEGLTARALGRPGGGVVVHRNSIPSVPAIQPAS